MVFPLNLGTRSLKVVVHNFKNDIKKGRETDRSIFLSIDVNMLSTGLEKSIIMLRHCTVQEMLPTSVIKMANLMVIAGSLHFFGYDTGVKSDNLF